MSKLLGDSVVVEQPRIEDKELQYTIGFRRRIPTKTIAGTIPKLLAAAKKILAAEGVRNFGKPFFRFYSIAMGKEYDLEVGYLTEAVVKDCGGMIANAFPAAKYATLKYAGKNRGFQGNKALIEWTRANGLEMDRWDTERGDTFACRYEVYISDIDREPDNKKWIKEVAIKLK
jgi:hypothetical protein